MAKVTGIRSIGWHRSKQVEDTWKSSWFAAFNVKYHIHESDGQYRVCLHMSEIAVTDTLDGAMAAAQRDWEERILALIEPECRDSIKNYADHFRAKGVARQSEGNTRIPTPQWADAPIRIVPHGTDE